MVQMAKMVYGLLCNFENICPSRWQFGVFSSNVVAIQRARFAVGWLTSCGLESHLYHQRATLTQPGHPSKLKTEYQRHLGVSRPTTQSTGPVSTVSLPPGQGLSNTETSSTQPAHVAWETIYLRLRSAGL